MYNNIGDIFMKKILIASYNLDFGGIEKSLITLLKNFDYDKYKVTLVLEQKEGAFLNSVPSCVKVKEYKISNHNNKYIRKIKNFFKRIRWIISNYMHFDASICYATYSKPCGFIARTSSKNSIIFTHSNYYLAFDKDDDKVRLFFNDININKYKKIVFVSNESRKDICKVIPEIENKSVTINNLVNYDEMVELSKKRVKEKKGKNKVVLFVGRLDESSKRISKILSLAKECKENNDKVIFWIVGTGPDEKKYKAYVTKNKLDNVVFCGSKENPYPYFKVCDYVILTSKYEGFPVVYNEAIVFNKPIITTVDVSDDYISIKNRFGYIINENDIYNEFKNILKDKNFKQEYVDFNNLNKKRIEAIEMIMEKK